ncbi:MULTISPECIES: signal recognition particle-docking protein FtsY [Brachymonas]|uniref:signal recognition particle-docking protein FtsY n=1 Tax=Brachymonas TaxID=28219 RepID=UPI0016A043A8|nr:signal recognition particle-docking protein FtsY [Brachymonas sp. J145]MEE1652881.1 signal recognition particle-docking protein FtsY [Brachymonas sp. J145]NLX15857.1 signal recognition particle-docking protein FtsY [Ramlibacter sp.]
MFSFFKKKPAAAPDAELPVDSAPDSVTEATPAVVPEPEPAADVAAKPAAEAPKGWLNRLRRSFGSDEEPAASTVEAETPAGETAAAELPPIDEEELERAAMEAATEHELPPEIIEPVPPVVAPVAAVPAPMDSPAEAIASDSYALSAPPQERPESLDPDRAGWYSRLKTGLRRTGSNISTVFTGTRIDDELYEDLEAALLMADAGVQATEFLLEDLKQRVKNARASDPAQVKALLVDAVADLLAPLQKPLVIGEHTPTVIMVAGVNGAGKTTSIGKLTKHLSDHQQQVLLAAADTFRAAAREQLAIWADRNTVEIVSSSGGDPAALSFDAVAAGRAREKDVVLVDTAGRLPTQLHLMDELKKIRRTITKAYVTAPHEVLLVIDGNTGQNALAQVKAFDEALELTGLIVTKLDGTAKGGVLCAIAREKPVPVYFVGVGEKLEDLQTFNAREFAQALLG